MDLKKYKQDDDTLIALTEEADNGVSESQLKVGLHYLFIAFDDSVKDDFYEGFLQAIYWLSKAVSNDVYEAYYWLGEAILKFRKEKSNELFSEHNIKECTKYNSVYIDISDKLNKDGYIKGQKLGETLNVNQAIVFLNDVGFGRPRRYFNLDDDCVQYIRTAAMHGIVPAEAEIGRILYECWINWCSYFKKDPCGALEDVRCYDNGLEDVRAYYTSSLQWLLKAIEHGEDHVIEYLSNLIKSKHDLDFIVKVTEYSPYKDPLPREEVASYLYDSITDKIYNDLKMQDGEVYPNALLDLGEQVENGASEDLEAYDYTIISRIRRELDRVSESLKWALFQYGEKTNHWGINDMYTVEVNLDEELIKELFQRVCSLAKEDFSAYQLGVGEYYRESDYEYDG